MCLKAKILYEGVLARSRKKVIIPSSTRHCCLSLSSAKIDEVYERTFVWWLA